MDKEAIEKIKDALDSIESSWCSDYRQSRLPVIAKKLLKELGELGYSKVDPGKWPLLSDDIKKQEEIRKKLTELTFCTRCGGALLKSRVRMIIDLVSQAQLDYIRRIMEG